MLSVSRSARTWSRLSAVAMVALVASVSAHAQGARPSNPYGNPVTIKPASTTPAIDVRDLRIRLYQFADDSMMGRATGHIGNMKGTTYIANEVKRLGLVPGGDNGTYYQVLPYRVRKFTSHSRMTINGNPLMWNDDWVPVPVGLPRAPRPINEAEVIFGGVAGDTTLQITAAQAAGKFVVLLPAPPATGRGGTNVIGGGGGGGRGGRGGGGAARPRFADAVAVATANLDALTGAQRLALNEPTTAQGGGRGGGRGGIAGASPADSIRSLRQQLVDFTPQATIRITRAAGAQLFGGKALETLALGAIGGTVNASLDFIEVPTEWARNVIAIIPGSDPKLKYQYVAVGAHNDHVGLTAVADKDSIRAFNIIRNRLLLANNMNADTAQASRSAFAAKVAAIVVNMDSIRKIHPKPRLDSINNGADDDGSGSMAVLEMAEAIQGMKVKPKRSTLFVWHTGEETGLIGSEYFVRNPTVPLDSVVAQINIDMIGRGRADDIPGGGPNYLAVVGSLFDSKDLGETVQAVNTKQPTALDLDYKFDKPIAWGGYNNIYGRSDHFNYARSGVPIAFFFTGLHGDYHQRSDEPEFIDYPHYARIANYICDLVVEVGNGPRPRLNGTQPAKPRVIVP